MQTTSPPDNPSTTPNPPALPYNGIWTPYMLMQLIATVFLGILAITTTDGLQTQIVYALLTIAGTNAVAQGVYGALHVVSNASIQRAVLSAKAPEEGK